MGEPDVAFLVEHSGSGAGHILFETVFDGLKRRDRSFHLVARHQNIQIAHRTQADVAVNHVGEVQPLERHEGNISLTQRLRNASEFAVFAQVEQCGRAAFFLEPQCAQVRELIERTARLQRAVQQRRHPVPQRNLQHLLPRLWRQIPRARRSPGSAGRLKKPEQRACARTQALMTDRHFNHLRPSIAP